MKKRDFRAAARLLAPFLEHVGACEGALSDINLWLESEEKSARGPRPMSIRSATSTGPPFCTTRAGYTLSFVHVWTHGTNNLTVEVLRKKNEDDAGIRRRFTVTRLLRPLGLSPRTALQVLATTDDGW